MKRKEEQSLEDYKKERKEEQKKTEAYLKGRMSWMLGACKKKQNNANKDYHHP